MEVDRIVMEASSKEDRTYMRSMSKHDISQINAVLVQKMYEHVLKYNKCDFGNIPKSKGHIMDVDGMDDTVQCLDILLQLHQKNNIPHQDIEAVKTAISTMNRLSNSFGYGFSTNNDYLKIGRAHV